MPWWQEARDAESHDSQVVLSQSFNQLNSTYPGIVRMKGLARMHIWWPGIDSDILQTAHNCSDSQSVRNQPATATLGPQNRHPISKRLR